MSTRENRFHFALLALAAAWLAPGLAQAESSTRYSLPWQLRPVTISSAARLDGAVAAFNDAGGYLDVAITSVLSVSYRASEEVAPVLRLGFVRNDAPGVALDGSSLANPLLGASWGRGFGPFEWTLFGAATIPIGSGGGSEPDAQAARANLAARTARPGDDAMFAVDYLTPMAGGDFAYIDDGFTAQVEGTVQGSLRVRGAESSNAPERFRSNAAVGLHLGYFLGSHFSVGSDLRYARWLSHPERDANSLSLAGGLRLHFRLGKDISIHPGLAALRGFGGRSFATPLATTETTAVQLDIPVAF